MSSKNANGTLTLEQRLRLLRRDTVKVLAQLDLSESLLDVEEVLEDERWLATPEENKVFDFIRSLAIISTKLRPETFADTKNGLTEFWKNIECESDWEDCQQGIISN